ncbi:MAG: hypothetical protein NDI61_10520 [Bdellovibrionaceae bacterium]|nr:hypothetical protein [Pseudobdellovibrionaceae bacterium]
MKELVSVLMAWAILTNTSMAMAKDCNNKVKCADRYKGCLSVIKRNSDALASSQVLDYVPKGKLSMVTASGSSGPPTQGATAIEEHPTTWTVAEASGKVNLKPQSKELTGEIKISTDEQKKHCRTLYDACLKEKCK